MISPIEHLMSGAGWQAFRKAKTLHRSLAFLFFALIAMRVGSFLPLPGGDTQRWSEFWINSPFAHLGTLF